MFLEETVETEDDLELEQTQQQVVPDQDDDE